MMEEGNGRRRSDSTRASSSAESMSPTTSSWSSSPTSSLPFRDAQRLGPRPLGLGRDEGDRVHHRDRGPANRDRDDGQRQGRSHGQPRGGATPREVSVRGRQRGRDQFAGGLLLGAINRTTPVLCFVAQAHKDYPDARAAATRSSRPSTPRPADRPRHQAASRESPPNRVRGPRDPPPDEGVAGGHAGRETEGPGGCFR